MLIEDIPSEEEHLFEKEIHKISSISSLDSLDQVTNALYSPIKDTQALKHPNILN